MILDVLLIESQSNLQFQRELTHQIRGLFHTHMKHFFRANIDTLTT